MNFQISLKPPYNSKKTFTCLEISISTLIYHNPRSFMDVVQTYALHQHVSFHTHVHGHWLDLFITRSTCTNIKAIFPTDGVSDHHCVIIDLWLQVGSTSRKKMITFRPINKININTLHDDLANSDILMKPKSTLCELVNQYNETLSKLLDKHAPKQTKSVQDPLIKKQTLCKSDLRNYRPISNLSFLSKILEKVVANRLHGHIYDHHLSNDLQSAYKRFHSTKTVLLKIHNDIVDNMDNDKVTALTLLDLSAAFDTIDHSILLQRLHRYFRISGPALRWFKSFLSDRYQSINISGTLSRPHHLPFGVPQGSVLGPVLFSLYTTSLSQVIANRNLSHHLYADDTQVYISLSQPNVQESLSTLSDCLTDILSWMESSKLKLNPDKTYLIIIGTKQQRSHQPFPS